MLPVLRPTSVTVPFAETPNYRPVTLFDSVFGTDGAFLNRTSAGMPMAMCEDEDNITIEAEIPGVTEDDVTLTVHNDKLSIRCERRPDQGRRYLYNGRIYGQFERVITLPEAVKTDAVQAMLTNGVLRINLPKSPEAKPKRISVQAG